MPELHALSIMSDFPTMHIANTMFYLVYSCSQKDVHAAISGLIVNLLIKIFVK